MTSFFDIASLGIASAISVLIIGFIVGLVGIGGVLLAPTLSLLGGLPIHDAIRVCMWVYVGTGIVGAVIFLRNGYINFPKLLAISAGACPGALAGALTLDAIGVFHLETLIALVILLSGIYTLFGLPPRANEETWIGKIPLFLVGIITGFGSALTGTSGPIILIPILLFARVDVKLAVGLAQAIQVPIGIVATAANVWTHRVDLALGAVLIVVLSIGIVAGASFAHRASNLQLRKWLGLALVLIAVSYGFISAANSWKIGSLTAAHSNAV